MICWIYFFFLIMSQKCCQKETPANVWKLKITVRHTYTHFSGLSHFRPPTAPPPYWLIGHITYSPPPLPLPGGVGGGGGGYNENDPATLDHPRPLIFLKKIYIAMRALSVSRRKYRKLGLGLGSFGTKIGQKIATD